MRKRYFLIKLLLLFLLIQSCGTTMQLIEVDSKIGYFPTNVKIKDNEILVNLPCDLKDYNNSIFCFFEELYINKYKDYIISSIKQTSEFNQVWTKEDLERYIIKNDLTESINNVSDLINTSKLTKYLNNFLILKSQMYIYDYNYAFEVEIYDAKSAELLFHVRHETRVLGGLDGPLYYPVFNRLIDWFKANN